MPPFGKFHAPGHSWLFLYQKFTSYKCHPSKNVMAPGIHYKQYCIPPTWLSFILLKRSSQFVSFFYGLYPVLGLHILPTVFESHTFFVGYLPGGGGGLKLQRGIRLVHGLTKSTLITYFSGMKIDPKYVFLHAFFLICLSCSFQNLSIWPKTHPFFQFCTFLHP